MAQARATEGSTPSSSGTHHQQGNVGPAAPRPRGMLLEVQDTSLPETGGETTLACRTKHHSQQLPEATRPPACLLWAGSTCPQRGHISAANGLRSHQVRPERTQSLMSTQVFPLNGVSELLRYRRTASQSWVLPLCRYLVLKEGNSGWIMSTALTEPLHLLTQQGSGPSHLKTDCETTHTNGCHCSYLSV